jgi:hypothetical protein
VKGLRTAQLLAIGERLTRRERRLIEAVEHFSLLSQVHASQLLALDQQSSGSSASVARSSRRVLQRLTELGLLARLERRIGGLRAGSSGYVYYLGPAGQRLLAYWRGEGLIRGRFRPEPGSRYVRHRLAVSQLYVDARLAAARGELELLGFDAEPQCWRRYADQFAGETLLKPDAYLRIGLGAYEDRFFVEVDLGTESRTVIARKLQTYIAYFRAGHEQAEHGVFPRVLLLTNSAERRAALIDLGARLSADDWQLFTINELANFTAVIKADIAHDAHNEQVARGMS